MSDATPTPGGAAHLVRLELRADEPFAVAAPEIAAAVDRPLARRPDGTVFVPATSLAGSLRSHLRSLALDEQLMGSRPPLSDDTGDGAELDPSALRLLGARVEAGATWVRGQTAIHRGRGAAEPGTLRTSELAPSGTVIVLYGLSRRQLTGGELAALASWQPWVGGGKTSGLGRFTLLGLDHQLLDLTTPEGLRHWLSRSGPALFDHLDQHLDPIRGPEAAPLLTVTLRIVDPLFTAGRPGDNGDPSSEAGAAAGGEAGRGNVSPIARRGDGTLALEGSAVKGVFRSRCEHILTSLGLGSEDVAPLAGELFGSIERRGLLAFSAAVITGPRLTRRDHVAIDRFTGGARDGLLFSEQPVDAGELTLRISALAPGIPAWTVPMLRAVVRDLNDGYLGLGGRTTRGFGTVEVVSIEPDEPVASVGAALAGIGALP
jgi:CRISPR/Cas system CSM-associated protein Csm3 (group 7 of RAMP superfamily)